MEYFRLCILGSRKVLIISETAAGFGEGRGEEGDLFTRVNKKFRSEHVMLQYHAKYHAQDIRIVLGVTEEEKRGEAPCFRDGNDK